VEFIKRIKGYLVEIGKIYENLQNQGYHELTKSIKYEKMIGIMQVLK
jgi:hypothetical protein